MPAGYHGRGDRDRGYQEEPIGFEALHDLLAAHLRRKVREGQCTERGLARLVGLSQPHMHNAIKGAREMSFRTADKVLRALRITIHDLLAEAGAGAPRKVATSAEAGRTRPARA
ncbi:MAG: helix-turn-helix domain-containing protein [Bryobacteraceae bacterium]